MKALIIESNPDLREVFSVGLGTYFDVSTQQVCPAEIPADVDLLLVGVTPRNHEETTSFLARAITAKSPPYTITIVSDDETKLALARTEGIDCALLTTEATFSQIREIARVVAEGDL